MTLTLYIDVYPWTKPDSSFAVWSQHVPAKDANATRYKVEVIVADPAQPDAEAPGCVVAKEPTR